MSERKGPRVSDPFALGSRETVYRGDSGMTPMTDGLRAALEAAGIEAEALFITQGRVSPEELCAIYERHVRAWLKEKAGEELREKIEASVLEWFNLPGPNCSAAELHNILEHHLSPLFAAPREENGTLEKRNAAMNIACDRAATIVEDLSAEAATLRTRAEEAEAERDKWRGDYNDSLEAHIHEIELRQKAEAREAALRVRAEAWAKVTGCEEPEHLRNVIGEDDLHARDCIYRLRARAEEAERCAQESADIMRRARDSRDHLREIARKALELRCEITPSSKLIIRLISDLRSALRTIRDGV